MKSIASKLTGRKRHITNCGALRSREVLGARSVVPVPLHRITNAVLVNHRRTIQRACKEYQGPGSTPRYFYLIGFRWSPGIGILKNFWVILMCSQG